MDQIFDPPYTVFACVHEWSCPDMSPRSRSMKDTARSRALQHYSQKNEFHLLLHTVNFSAQSAGDTLHYTLNSLASAEMALTTVLLLQCKYLTLTSDVKL